MLDCRDFMLALEAKTYLHMLHHVELCSNDFNISAVQERLRYRETSSKQGLLHLILPLQLQTK